jgi:hypothetical protein
MAIVIRSLTKNIPASNPAGGVVSYWLGLDASNVAITLSVDSTQTNCDVLNVGGVRSLAVKPSASVTKLTFYGCDTSGGTFVLIDSLGTSGDVTVVASKWNTIVATSLFPYAFIQMKSDQASATAVVMAKN